MSSKEQKYKAERMRAWRHGMRLAELRAFLEDHDYRCDICGKREDELSRSGGLVIDHDHSCCGATSPRIPVADRPKKLCGKCMRGLLCYACNNGIGMFADDPERLERAAAYLRAKK